VRRTLRLPAVGAMLGLVLLCIAGTLLNGQFATADNALNVLTRTAFIGIIAVGMCFVIISGGIDLSVGSMAALIAGATILLMNKLVPLGWSPVVVVMVGMSAAVLLGAVFGLAHGLLITRGRIEPFIVTLGTLGGQGIQTLFSRPRAGLRGQQRLAGQRSESAAARSSGAKVAATVDQRGRLRANPQNQGAFACLRKPRAQSAPSSQGRIGNSVLPDYLWAVCGDPEQLRRVVLRGGRSVRRNRRPPAAVDNSALPTATHSWAPVVASVG